MQAAGDCAPPRQRSVIERTLVICNMHQRPSLFVQDAGGAVLLDELSGT